MSMPLKRKIAVFSLVLFFVFLTVRYFKAAQHLAEASAKIRIETKFSAAGESLLAAQAKEITQPATLIELLHRLGRLSDSPEKNKQQMLEIQKHIQVTREGNTEIFNITVRHSDPKWARETASQLAQAFQSVELSEAIAQGQYTVLDLEHRTAAARDSISAFEETFRKVQNQNKPSDIDTVLLSRLKEKEARYETLSKTYTSIHPDMVELNKEIESLKMQIMDGPPIDLNAVQQAENNLRDADARYRKLLKQTEEARLQAQTVTGHVKILEISSTTARQSRKINPAYLGVMGIILLLALFLRAVSR